MKTPCYNCADRHENCHSDCKRYKEYHSVMEEKKRVRNENKGIFEDANGYQIGSIAKTKRRAHR